MGLQEAAGWGQNGVRLGLHSGLIMGSGWASGLRSVQKVSHLSASAEAASLHQHRPRSCTCLLSTPIRLNISACLPALNKSFPCCVALSHLRTSVRTHLISVSVNSNFSDAACRCGSRAAAGQGSKSGISGLPDLSLQILEARHSPGKCLPSRHTCNIGKVQTSAD